MSITRVRVPWAWEDFYIVCVIWISFGGVRRGARSEREGEGEGRAIGSFALSLPSFSFLSLVSPLLFISFFRRLFDLFSISFFFFFFSLMFSLFFHVFYPTSFPFLFIPFSLHYSLFLPPIPPSLFFLLFPFFLREPRNHFNCRFSGNCNSIKQQQKRRHDSNNSSISCGKTITNNSPTSRHPSNASNANNASKQLNSSNPSNASDPRN